MKYDAREIEERWKTFWATENVFSFDKSGVRSSNEEILAIPYQEYLLKQVGVGIYAWSNVFQLIRILYQAVQN